MTLTGKNAAEYDKKIVFYLVRLKAYLNILQFLILQTVTFRLNMFPEGAVINGNRFHITRLMHPDQGKLRLFLVHKLGIILIFNSACFILNTFKKCKSSISRRLKMPQGKRPTKKAMSNQNKCPRCMSRGYDKVEKLNLLEKFKFMGCNVWICRKCGKKWAG